MPFKLRQYNLTRTSAKYSSLDRFEFDIAPKRSSNQYTATTIEDRFNDCYKHIIVNSITRSDCWILNKARGIDKTFNGYHRVSLNGQKVLAHVLVYLYHHPGEAIEGDISHICGQRSCCNPKHLFDEKHLDNMTRIPCLGTLIPTDQSLGPIIRLCIHTPVCTKQIVYSAKHIV
jgi:hypothetical protein